VRLSYRNFLDRGKSETRRLLNHNATGTDLFFLSMCRTEGTHGFT